MATARAGVALLEEITRQRVPNGGLAVWWLGQASLALKIAGEIVYVDPYLKPGPHRLMPPAFEPGDAKHIDLILCTHDHGDHIDDYALPPLMAASPQARLVAPRPVAARLSELAGDAARVLPAVAGEPLVLGPLEIIPVPARHEEFDLDDELGYPYLGYIVRTDTLTVYVAGDTIPYDGLVENLRAHAIDLAFLPINGRDFFRTRSGVIGNMDYREAAELAIAAGITTVVPVHYGMFAGNTVPPGHFVSHLAERADAPQAHVLAPRLPSIFVPA